jgi:hypothetical protein
MHGGAGAKTCILGNLGAMLASAITSHYGHLWLAIGYCHAKQVGHLAHRVGSAYWAKQTVKAAGVSSFYEGIRHTSASRESTAATVGTGQQGIHLCNARVFIHSKFLGGGIQHQCGDESDGSKHNYCN